MIERAADWLLAYWLHGVVLGAALGAVARLARRPATRALLWRAALVAPLATASVATLTTVAAAPGSGGGVASVVAPLRPHLPPEWRARDVRVRVVRHGDAPARATVIVRDPLSRVAALAVCLAVVAGTLAGATALARRHHAARRVLGGRTPLGRDGGVRLSAAPALASPVALRGGEICLPTDWPLDDSARRGVLLHERAHVARRDPLWLDLTRAIVAVAWWQPMNVVALRALRRDTEFAADDLALAWGADPRALVAGLAHFAARRDPLAAGAPFAAPDSPLVARARRILGGDHAARERWALLVVAAALAGGALTLVPRPTVLEDALIPRDGVRRDGVRRDGVRRDDVRREVILMRHR